MFVDYGIHAIGIHIHFIAKGDMKKRSKTIYNLMIHHLNVRRMIFTIYTQAFHEAMNNFVNEIL